MVELNYTNPDRSSNCEKDEETFLKCAKYGPIGVFPSSRKQGFPTDSRLTTVRIFDLDYRADGMSQTADMNTTKKRVGNQPGSK